MLDEGKSIIYYQERYKIVYSGWNENLMQAIE